MHTNQHVTEVIKNGLNDELDDILRVDPSIANGKTEQGISILLFAAYCRNGKAVELLKKHRQHLDIYEASSLGELVFVKKELNSAPGIINKPSVDGFSALGLSCFFGHYDVAAFLVENGADVNLPSSNAFKVAPIHSACAISNFAIVELLLKNGADPNLRQQQGVSALHEAAHHGKTDLVKLLIEYKADINAKTDSGQTPLFMAEEKSFTDTASVIREFGGQ